MINEQHAKYPSLKNKVVFVTGGSSGIGAEIVSAFAQQGAKVGFVGRNVAHASALVSSLGNVNNSPLFIQADVTDVAQLQNSIEQCSQHFGDIDVLINNVANDQRHDLEAIDVEFFDWMIAVNFRPHVFAIQTVVPGMRRLGGGSIINIGSISWMRKNSSVVLYGALKSAAVGLTKGLARKLGEDYIRVNHLVPGWTMTEKQKREWLDETGEKAIAAGQCLPDKLQPQDIASMALFLASNDSRMITSQDFVVDGGWT